MPKLPLTQQRIAEASCPQGVQEVKLWDTVQPGLFLRIRSSGAKRFALRYRPGGGRQAPLRTLLLGEVGALSLADARKRARVKLGEVADGRDPNAEARAGRQESRRQERARLSAALAAYAATLERRQIVKGREWLSLLRRELLAPLGDRDLRELERAELVALVRRLEAAGRRGKAQELRTRAAVFLNWCCNEGIIAASPLAGFRQPRKTRAERLTRPGRALADHELAIVWPACEAAGDPIFTAYLRTLLLTGQRRTETSLMRWSDVALDRAAWTIPPEVTKAGREHRVPLSADLVALLAGLPKRLGTDLVFFGRGGRPISGFSKRLAAVQAVTASAGLAHWTLHDLRRTVRTGLGRLGVPAHIAELLLNHQLSDELAAIYDRGFYWPERVEAAKRWSRHVLEQLVPVATAPPAPDAAA